MIPPCFIPIKIEIVVVVKQRSRSRLLAALVVKEEEIILTVSSRPIFSPRCRRTRVTPIIVRRRRRRRHRVDLTPSSTSPTCRRCISRRPRSTTSRYDEVAFSSQSWFTFRRSATRTRRRRRQRRRQRHGRSSHRVRRVSRLVVFNTAVTSECIGNACKVFFTRERERAVREK